MFDLCLVKKSFSLAPQNKNWIVHERRSHAVVP